MLQVGGLSPAKIQRKAAAATGGTARTPGSRSAVAFSLLIPILQSIERRWPRRSASRLPLLHEQVEDLGGKMGKKLSSAGPPVQALDLIGKNDSDHLDIRWEADLKGIALLLRRHRAEQCQADESVVGTGRKDNGRPSARLFVSSLWMKRQPDHISTLRNVVSHSPHLIPKGRPRWDLLMEVLFGDFVQELCKGKGAGSPG